MNIQQRVANEDSVYRYSSNTNGLGLQGQLLQQYRQSRPMVLWVLLNSGQEHLIIISPWTSNSIV